MNIEEQLTGGNPRSLGEGPEVVLQVLADNHLLPDLFECLFSKNEIVRMRASDALEKVCREHPDWLDPFVDRLLNEVAHIDQSSVRWHLAQILGEMALDNDQAPIAVEIVVRNLEATSDWIVTTLSLEALASFASAGHLPKERYLDILARYENCAKKSISTKVRRLRARL